MLALVTAFLCIFYVVPEAQRNTPGGLKIFFSTSDSARPCISSAHFVPHTLWLGELSDVMFQLLMETNPPPPRNQKKTKRERKAMRE